jgi:primosomal protein N' (replication factor Y)
MSGASFARVLIDSPLPQLDRLFDYRIPEELADSVRPGVRVKVPLRSAGRVADALVVELADAVSFTGAVSPIEAVVSPVVVLTPEVWALARRLADRAAGSASDVLRLALPGRQARVEKAWLATRGGPAHRGGELPPVRPAPLEHYGHDLERVLAESGKAAVDAVPRLTQVTGSDGRATWVGQWAATMAAAATHALAAGGSAVLAVPDYRDQQQLMLALSAVLPPERIAQLDARQPNADRYRAFLRCLEGEPLALVGNRSVIYAPAPSLGLIALWDDGDPLYGEPLAPYVHTRDAALVRHEQQGGALLFAGHTRTPETQRLHAIGWLESISPARLATPRVILAGQQSSDDRLAAQARIPPIAWREAREALNSGPVLLQVGRPGYALHLVCADCAEQARCDRCDGPLHTSMASAFPSCSWCGAVAGGWRCPTCTGTKYRQVGSGSVRTAEDLGRAFPGTRVIVADADHQHLTLPSKPALVVATRGAEPVADGGYCAVLLLDGERMIARESLRVAEDCLRWWSNAAALAAPNAPVILVGVAGALASALATWRQGDHARGELADRRRLHFPPAVRVATIVGTAVAVGGAVEAVRAELIDALGPVPVEDGRVRAIVRFEYAHGAAVAAALRAEVIRSATAPRRSVAGRRPSGRAVPVLRVRFDDPEPFAEDGAR